MTFTKQFFIFGLGGALSRFAAIVLVPLYTRVLSIAEYGQLEVLLAAHMLTVILAGMQTESAVARDYFTFKSRGEGQQLGWSALAITAVGVVIISSASCAALLVGGLPAELSRTTILLLLGLIFPVQLFGIQQAMLRFEGSPKYFAFVSFCDLTFSAVFSVVFIAIMHFGPDGALLGLLSGKLIAVAIAWPRTFGNPWSVRLDRSVILGLLNYGIPSMPAVIVNWMHNVGNRLILAFALPLSEVALAGLAIKVAAIYGFVIYSYRLAWEPFAMTGLTKLQSNRLFYREAQEWYVLSMFVMAGVAVMLGPYVAHVLAPPEYAKSAAIAVFFGFGQFWVGMTNLSGIGIQGARRTSQLLPVFLSGLLVNLVFLLVGSYFLGALAAGLGFLAGSVCSAWVAQQLSNKLFDTQFDNKFFGLTAFATAAFVTIWYQVIVHYSSELNQLSVFSASTLSAGICLLIVMQAAIFFYASSKSRLAEMLDLVWHTVLNNLGLKVIRLPLSSAVKAASLNSPPRHLGETALVRLFKYSRRREEVVAVTLDTKLRNTTYVINRSMEFGYCHRFNDASSGALVECVPLDLSEDFAVSFWHRITAVVQSGSIVIGDAGGRASLEIAFDSFNWPVAILGSENLQHINATSQSELGPGWYQIFLQLRHRRFELFLNGQLIASLNAANPSRIGNLNLKVLNWLGDLDDVRVYDFSIHANEVPNLVYEWHLEKPPNPIHSMIRLFRFDDNALDATGNGLEGVTYNVEPAPDRFGDINKAYAFNGSNAFIELIDRLDIAPSAFAIGFWERSDSRENMVALSLAWDHLTLDFVFNGHAAMSIITNDGPTKVDLIGEPGSLTDGIWHFVFVQRFNSIQTIYVDGILRCSVPISNSVSRSSAKLQFGRSLTLADSSLCCWEGLIDDVQVYNHSFTAEEIKDLEGLHFLPNDGAGLLSFKDKLWLLGGWNPTNKPTTNSEVWSSADGSNWSLVKIAPWEGRHTAGYLVFKDRMWIIGGDRNMGHYQNDVWSSVDGVRWDLITDTVPWANRATHYVFAFDNRMWVIGGQEVDNPKGMLVAFNDVYSSYDGKTWVLETDAAPWSPRGMVMGSVVHRGRMWIIGGGTYDFRTFNNDVWNSPDGVNWNLVVEAAPWSARQYHSTTVFNDAIWVIGGNSYGNPGQNDVWYSSDGINWTELTASPWPIRHASSVSVHRLSMWMVGGSALRPFNDVWRLGYAT